MGRGLLHGEVIDGPDPVTRLIYDTENKITADL